MSAFVIQSNIPVPARGAAPRESKYPLAQLGEGQSFFVPGAGKTVPVTVAKQAKKLGMKVATRNTVEHVEFDADGLGVGEKVKGIRVWRQTVAAA